jgi:HlyD family secretion protein
LMMRVTVGRIMALLLLLVAIVGTIWVVLPRPIPVETYEAKKGHFVATVDDDGKTRIRERYVVAAPLAGRLNRVQLKAGDRVSTGAVLASILPSPAPFLDPRARRESQERLGAAEAALERAKALVERAQAQTVQAEQELTRTRRLVERGASTAQALERAELAKRVADRDLHAAEFQLHAAEHELDQTRALLARYNDGPKEAPEAWTITAPVTGIVLNVSQESETIVQPGTPILDLGDPGDVEIVVDVLSSDAVEIRPGAQVTIENWGGPNALEGRVRRVEPAAFTKISTLGVEEQRVNVLIDIVSPSDRWSGLGDSFRVDAQIVVFSLEDATIVPAGALFRRGGVWHVFTVANGRAQLTPVVVIRRAARSAAIASGLTIGQSVIVYPSDQVEAGVRVRAASR